MRPSSLDICVERIILRAVSLEPGEEGGSREARGEVVVFSARRGLVYVSTTTKDTCGAGHEAVVGGSLGLGSRLIHNDRKPESSF